jgi:hypothetical protein
VLDRLRIVPYISPVKKLKRPRNQTRPAKQIADLSTLQASQTSLGSEKNLHAVELGRLGGLKGGVARAKVLSKAERSSIAKKAARVRWSRKNKKR